ncbi:Conserved membrane protein YqhR [Salinibacillus kushneri]|uniref:Conserved membrane protein YqhR n=1 Tax=Salinibacillus kushneri TaxID=237682 RepID=A0A1I0FVS6_9BACI|nr:YqhR family membrane protein [Salinibacillus kushneri]SET61578.1 Conserved membrane protein YqhR [Salinibacillus kushneri]
MKKEKLEQNEHEKPMSLLQKALLTGFIGGIFWGLLGSLAYYFHFSEISHATFTLRSFWQANWTAGLTGEMVSVLLIGVFSILIAYIYYLLFKKREGMIPGILYGIAIWFIFMYFFNPMFVAVPSIADMNIDTVITTICLLILYGTFIGYSISFEYKSLEDMKQQRKENHSQNA